MLQKFLILAIGSKTVVRYLSHHAKVNGSSLATAASTRRANNK
jgi:hypothetical protein